MVSFYYDAKADIKGGRNYPGIRGVVYFKETPNHVLVTAKIDGLPQSNDKCAGRFFGFHIHEGNSCSGTVEDKFANVGGHFNPTNCPHPFHVGDLPPLIESDGSAYMSVMIGKFRLRDIIGRAVIIHDMPDDFTSQPSGNAGKKIACGVIW